jgi:hypothetical protein
MFLSGKGYKIFTGFEQRICFTGAADSNPLIEFQGEECADWNPRLPKRIAKGVSGRYEITCFLPD